MTVGGEARSRHAAGTSNIGFALFVVVFWPFPHLTPTQVSQGRVVSRLPKRFRPPGLFRRCRQHPPRAAGAIPATFRISPRPTPPTLPDLPTPTARVGTHGRRRRRCGCAQPPPRVRVRRLCALESAGQPCGRAGVDGRPPSAPCWCSGECGQRSQAARSIATRSTRGHRRLVRVA